MKTTFSDPARFEVLYKQYFPMLVGFAFQYVENSDIAKDVVQEVFSKVWNNAKNLDIRTNEKSYLFGAVRNACLNHLRHEGVKKEHASETSRQSFIEQEAFLEMDELQEKINKALDDLPEKRRQIFELSRFENKKYSEIAKELNLSVKTVETQMSRALKALREVLGSYLLYFLVLSLVFWVEACKGRI
ncbi:MAG: RNA polymerase sigma-70 factor [Bacteroidota bacterium]